MSAGVQCWNVGARGTPLVLLHGFLGSPRSFERLVTDHLGTYDGPVIAPALPGHDATVPADPARGWDAAIDDVAERIEAITASAVHICGYSLGARVALGLIVRHPALAVRATLVGVNPGLADEAARHARREADARWAAMLRTRGLTAFLAAWEAQPLFDSQRGLPPEVLAMQRAGRRAHDPEQLARSLELLGLAGMPDYSPRLAAVSVPVRLVVGEKDDRFRAIARRMADSLPSGTLDVVPAAGHNVLLEAPEALARLILAPAPRS